MTRTTRARARRLAARLHQAYVEMDHAQRRLLEIRTGLSFAAPGRRPEIAASAAELEALYAYEDPRLNRLGQP
jgi:hypothetical protein